MLRLLSNIVESVSDDAVYVGYEPSCVVPEDPGEIVRHARPLDERARQQLLEQHIARLLCQTAVEAHHRAGSARALAHRG